MVGAYLAYALTQALGNLWLSLVAAVPLALIIGLLLELLFRPLYRRDHLYQVLLTYGLILALEETRSLLFGDDVHGVPIPPALDFSVPLTADLSYPVYRLWISAACLALAGALYLVISKTRIGMAIRAGAANREMVQLLGIDVGMVFRIVFVAGVVLAAFAGMIAAPVATVYPGMGNAILILSFVVVVIGGIGSIKGAFVAALLIGLADTFGQVVAPDFAGMTVYVLMAAVLLWRPAGLFGRGT
jgi:branched-chain amino acid transport system permease protein